MEWPLTEHKDNQNWAVRHIITLEEQLTGVEYLVKNSMAVDQTEQIVRLQNENLEIAQKIDMLYDIVKVLHSKVNTK